MFLYKNNNKLNFWAKWARVVFLYFISFISKSIHRLRVLQLVLLKSVQNCQFKASNMWKVAWRMLTNCTFCTNFYLFCKESVAVINKIINPPNCLLSKNPPKSFEAGADHTLNPAFSSLILPQLSQQMVQPPEKKTHRNTHIHSISLLVNRHTQHTYTHSSFILTALTQVTGRESRRESGMRGWGYVQERREWKSAVLWGNENRMWHDSKPDSLSLPSSPTTQSGFEVRFYLAPLTLTFLTQFCTTHCVTANSLSCEHRQPHRSTHLLWRDEEKQQESQSLHWLFPPLTVLPTKHKN